MFWNKEKKSFLKWLNFAVITMVEHDRVYHHLLEKNLTTIDVEKGEVKKAEIDTSSNNYLSGKYLFRTFRCKYLSITVKLLYINLHIKLHVFFALDTVIII